MSLLEKIKKLNVGTIVINGDLKKYTTYKVGGKAKLIVSPYNTKDLIKLIKFLTKEEVNYKILGAGSNLVFSDLGYDGVLIKLDEFDTLFIKENVVTVGAGYPLMKLAYKVSRLGLTGLEFATGIPGSVGGAVYMNAGAYKSDMSEIIKSVTVLTKDLKIKKLSKKDLSFSYRSSTLKEKDYICLSAELILKEGNKEEIMATIKDRKERRLLSQPLEYPTAGSVFRNPEGDFAGRIIESLNLKGFNIGGAYISEKHANFIINKDNASGNDVINLIEYVQEVVYEKTGIKLIVEQEIVK